MRTLVPLLALLIISGCAFDPSVRIAGEYVDGRPVVPVTVLSGDYDTAPKFITGQVPIYPLPLREKGIRSGEARLSYTITTKGRVRDIRVIRTSHPQFAAGAAHVMPGWRFVPAQKNGVPVEVVAGYEVHFTSKDEFPWTP